MAKLTLLASAAPQTTMLDDQKVDMHVTVSQGGTTILLPAGMTLAWASADATMTVNPAVDITGAPSTDPLAAIAFGVKGSPSPAGGSSIVATLMNGAVPFTNADGTGATVNFPFTITLDPAETDTTLGGTVGTPVKQ